jgi:hypothetical protein
MSLATYTALVLATQPRRLQNFWTMETWNGIMADAYAGASSKYAPSIKSDLSLFGHAGTRWTAGSHPTATGVYFFSVAGNEPSIVCPHSGTPFITIDPIPGRMVPFGWRDEFTFIIHLSKLNAAPPANPWNIFGCATDVDDNAWAGIRRPAAADKLSVQITNGTQSLQVDSAADIDTAIGTDWHMITGRKRHSVALARDYLELFVNDALNASAGFTEAQVRAVWNGIVNFPDAGYACINCLPTTEPANLSEGWSAALASYWNVALTDAEIAALFVESGL